MMLKVKLDIRRWSLLVKLHEGYCVNAEPSFPGTNQIPICRESEKKKSKVAQFCPTLCDPMDCSLPGSSIHGIFQARILEWVAISFSRRSSQTRDWTQVFCTAGVLLFFFTSWATREAHSHHIPENSVLTYSYLKRTTQGSNLCLYASCIGKQILYH